jgi:hypothetical protein
MNVRNNAPERFAFRFYAAGVWSKLNTITAAIGVPTTSVYD